MVRASLEVEKLGIPTASLFCRGFDVQGSATAKALGLPNLPIAVLSGHVDLLTAEGMQENIDTSVADQVVRCLTLQPKETVIAREPGIKDIVFTGSFEEVNEYFYKHEWTEGIPVVPPTTEKVEEFLKFTDRSPDEVIGVLKPDEREATIWNIAVNGVMAGCRPEYMPVLIAVVEVMADPKFGHEHLGHTPATECLITINGPIIKELDFNYGQGALRVGFQANTSIGRFWRLYLRNVAGFLLHKTDKGTFGGTWRVVLAENEDAVAKIGWSPMSVDQGFKAGDNVITVSSCTSSDSVSTSGRIPIEETLDLLAARIVDTNLWLFRATFLGCGQVPQVIMSPSVAEAIAKAGYSKDDVKRYWYEHAKFVASRFDRMNPPDRQLCTGVKLGQLPPQYCESEDPNRLVPIVWSPKDFMITVSGDPDRDNCFVTCQNLFIGYPVSKKINLPANWAEMLKKAK